MLRMEAKSVLFLGVYNVLQHERCRKSEIQIFRKKKGMFSVLFSFALDTRISRMNLCGPFIPLQIALY